jgi:hypothetical protein
VSSRFIEVASGVVTGTRPRNPRTLNPGAAGRGRPVRAPRPSPAPFGKIILVAGIFRVRRALIPIVSIPHYGPHKSFRLTMDPPSLAVDCHGNKGFVPLALHSPAPTSPLQRDRGSDSDVRQFTT